MTDRKFDELWMQISNVAKDIENTCNDGTFFDAEKKAYIYYEYNKFRNLNKQSHLSATPGTMIDDIRMDRHKVASCIAGAILSTHPMGFKDNPLRAGETPRVRMSYLANETLALFSALAIVKSFIRSTPDNELSFDPTLKERFLKEGYIFPVPKHDDYLPWLLYLLRESSIIGFNVLSFSNILYLLECYTFTNMELSSLKNVISGSKEDKEER